MLKRLSLCLLAAVAVMLVPTEALAQNHRFELTPYGSWKWGNSLNVTVEDDEGNEVSEDIRLKAAGSFGATLDIYFNPYVAFEALYSYQSSDVEATRVATGEKHIVGTGKIQYLHGGAKFILNPYNRKINGFLLLTAGATIYSDDGPDSNSQTRFSIGAGGGAKFWVSDSVALRLEARGFSTSTDLSQLGWICGYYTCGLTSFSQTYWQGEIKAGVTFGF